MNTSEELKLLAAQLEAECQMPYTVALMRRAAEELTELAQNNDDNYRAGGLLRLFK